MKYTYDKNSDYQKEIDKAVKDGNMVLAAHLEQQRNAKIDGEGLSYAKTNFYADHLEDINPYERYLREQMEVLDSTRAAGDRAAERTYLGAVNALGGQKAAAVSAAKEDMSKGYVQKALWDKNMDTLFKAAGKTGGIKEKEKKLSQSAYESLRNEIEKNMKSALSKIDGSVESARTAMESDKNKSYDKYMDSLLKVLREESEREQKERAAAATDAEKTAEAEYKKKLEMAKLLSKSGDFSLYRELGYSDAQVKIMEDYFRAAKKK